VPHSNLTTYIFSVVMWTTLVGTRGCGPRHAPRWSSAVHGSSGHRAITLTITAVENCRTQIRLIWEPERVTGNSFPGN